MFDIILSAANKLCPTVKMKINNHSEWFSHELLEEIHYKSELSRKYDGYLVWRNIRI